MTKPMNVESIEKATGKLWHDWVEELNRIGAQDLSHPDIARLLHEQLRQDGLDNYGWWAQGVTVAYEQHIGRRVPGQLANGKFELTISKTLDVPRGEIYLRAINWFEKEETFDNKKAVNSRSSETPIRSYWRCDFEDGSKFTVAVEAVGAKSKLVLSHTDIPSREEAEIWKAYWRQVIEELTTD